MAAALERRGPDGTHLHIERHAAFGHALLAATLEARHERQPFVHPETGCAIAADVRLDNRTELIEALDLSQKRQTVGDHELILQAYLKWGSECPQHLLGDFAFAIWDPKEASLFCARDQIGMRQLIYAYSKSGDFVFATDHRAMIDTGIVDPSLDLGRIADVIVDFEAIDLTSTAHAAAKRLPPAHWLRLRAGRLQLERYWTLVPPEPRRSVRPEEYMEEFREIFGQAVDARTRGLDQVGIALSGGIDSGSIAAFAGKAKLDGKLSSVRSYSCVSNDPSCKENQAIQVAAQMPGIEPRLIGLGDVQASLGLIGELARECQEPYDAILVLTQLMASQARAEGTKVLLFGMGGDTTIGSEDMAARHLRAGNFAQALKEARGAAGFFGVPEMTKSFLWSSAINAFVPQFARSALGSVKSRIRPITWRERLLHPEFARAVDFPGRAARFRELAAPPPFPNSDRTWQSMHPFMVLGIERADRVCSQHGVEARDPWLDRRVMKLMLSLPPDVIQHDGWPKWIVRAAMHDMLPEQVAWRRGKEHVGWAFRRESCNALTTSSAQHFAKGSLLKCYLSGKALADLQSGEPVSDEESRLRLRMLAFWSGLRE